MKILVIVLIINIIFQIHAQVIPNEINTILDKINLQSQKQDEFREYLGNLYIL